MRLRSLGFPAVGRNCPHLVLNPGLIILLSKINWRYSMELDFVFDMRETHCGRRNDVDQG